MKTIEEMSRDYQRSDESDGTTATAFQNGAEWMHKELIQWYDPKEKLPPDDMEVLCRIDCCYNTYLILRHNNLGWWMLASNGGRCVCVFEVVGWRPIHE